MTWLDRTIGWFAPEAEARRTRARALTDRLRAANGYDGAGKGRRNTWTRGRDTSANAESRAALPLLRARHREMVRNNPYAASALRGLTTNIVGAGIRPRAKAPVERVQEDARRRMLGWIETTAIDYDGRLNGYGLQSAAVRTAMESGDALIVRITERDPSNPVPLKVRLLEGDYLDHTKNGPMNGGYAVQGVQFDARHKRVGYWLHQNHPGDAMASLSPITGSKFTPAEDVIHLYEMLRPGQVRGVPRGTAALMRMKNLDDYQDARIEAQKIAACLVGIITEPEGEGDRKGDVLPEKLEPALFARLGAGEQVQFSTPPSVTGHGEFVSVEQHAIAIAYGIPFELLTGNLSEVNYSSFRAGMLQFLREVDSYRWNTLIPTLCDGLARWFNAAMALSNDPLTGVTWEWAPPQRELLDPSREVGPMVQMVRAGFKSQSQMIRETGSEADDVLDELEQDIKSLRSRGLTLITDPGLVSNAGVTQARQGETGFPDPANDPVTE